MPSLMDKIRRKSHTKDTLNDSTANVSQDATQGLATGKEEEYPPPPGPPPNYSGPPMNAQNMGYHHVGPIPGSGRAAHQNVQMGSNMGMADGALMGAETGGDPVTGMLGGQLLGGAVAQRVNQHQKHQHFRDEAMQYREGIQSGAVIPGGGRCEPQAGGEERIDRRDEKRQERWQRRAARRDGH